MHKVMNSLGLFGKAVIISILKVYSVVRHMQRTFVQMKTIQQGCPLAIAHGNCTIDIY